MGQCVSGQREGCESCDGSASCSERHGCLAAVKERRSRLYIARKCVVMLLCWHKYGKYSIIFIGLIHYMFFHVYCFWIMRTKYSWRLVWEETFKFMRKFYYFFPFFLYFSPHFLVTEHSIRCSFYVMVDGTRYLNPVQ